MSDALAHLDAAIAALCLEAYHGCDLGSMQPAKNFTIGEDLKRIDSAIGPKGESVFARIADKIQEAYVELLAARAALATTEGQP